MFKHSLLELFFLFLHFLIKINSKYFSNSFSIKKKKILIGKRNLKTYFKKQM